MHELDPGSELKWLVLHYFEDHDGFITNEEWIRFDKGASRQLDPILQTQWIPQGYIQHDQTKGGYELTWLGEQELGRLAALKFSDIQDQIN